MRKNITSKEKLEYQVKPDVYPVETFNADEEKFGWCELTNDTINLPFKTKLAIYRQFIYREFPACVFWNNNGEWEQFVGFITILCSELVAFENIYGEILQTALRKDVVLIGTICGLWEEEKCRWIKRYGQ
jgi:hypothetical protein